MSEEKRNPGTGDLQLDRHARFLAEAIHGLALEIRLAREQKEKAEFRILERLDDKLDRVLKLLGAQDSDHKSKVQQVYDLVIKQRDKLRAALGI